MSKSTLKHHLQLLTHLQIMDLVLRIYDNSKPAKEYLEYYLSPNEKEQFAKAKAIIVNEFYPKSNSADPKTRFSVAKKAISDFKALHPTPELLGDLMVTLVENASKFTFDYGDMWEQYYTSTVTNFEIALKFLEQNNLLDNFKLRCLDCLRYAERCGYGFPDGMHQVFYDYYSQ